MKQQPSKDYRGYRNAGIRMTEELAPELVHGREADERGALYAFHMFDKAHNVMLAERGLVPPGVGAKILGGFRALEAEPGGAVEARARIGGGMHSGEYYLIRALGEDVGGWDHVGRSSACLASVGRRVLQRDSLLDAFDAMTGFRAALIELAGQHLESVLPGYFFTQICQPASYGHFLLGHAQAFARHAERLRQAYARVNLNPGGGVATTGTTFAIDRQRVADLMGFDGVVENALDAIEGYDTAIECFAIIAMAGQQIERLTLQLERWVADENAVIDLADRYRASSSLAMNMRTPVMPGRGISFNVVGDLVKSFSTAGNLGAPNPDSAFLGLAGVLRLCTAVIPAFRVDAERARESLATVGYPGGTDLGALLVKAAGVPWRSAHQICGIMFRLCDERGIASAGVTGELLDEAAIDYFGRPLGLSTAEIQKTIDPLEIIRSRRHLGGAAPEPAGDLARRLKAALEDDRAWSGARRASLDGAARKLEQAIDAICAEAAKA